MTKSREIIIISQGNKPNLLNMYNTFVIAQFVNNFLKSIQMGESQ